MSKAWQSRGFRIVTADLVPLPETIKSLSAEHIQGDLVNRIKIFYDYDFDIIFHLAASLSSKAEVATEEAHRINVEGTMQLLMLAAYKSEKAQQGGQVPVPQFDRSLWLPGPGGQARGRGRERRRVEHSAHHVWLQQTVL